MDRRILLLAVCLPAIVSCEDDRPVKDLVGSRDGGDASSDARGSNDASSEGSPEASTSPYPALLSQTGLFSDMATETLGSRVRPFQPKYVLWSDGATKRRWLSLPAGQQIDTSDMDFWQYPAGTTAWKEFTVSGKRIETRMLRKTGPAVTDWVMIAYHWKADQSDAVAVPAGVQNADGTQHDIPDQGACHNCHDNMQDVLLGVTAVQLSHGLAGVTLSTLAAEGSLSVLPPSAGYTIPGGPVAEQALGYLHANCGVCHNAKSIIHMTRPMELWESTSALTTLEQTRGYLTTVGKTNSFNSMHTIEPGIPDQSTIFVRMSSRTPGVQMPPIGTEITDPTGLAKVSAFISSLPRPDGGASDAGRDAGGALDGG